MQGKVVVVTGANAGIGRATSDALAARGATVVMICRSRERGEAARQEIIAASGNPAIELVLADLGVMADVRRAAAEILAQHPRIHVLVNNAAVFLPTREETPDGLERTFATNYLSHFLLTHLLLDALQAGAPSRIINVASTTMGLKMTLDDLQLTRRKYSTFGAVGPTKLGLVLFTTELARRLEGTGVTVNALHPGLVNSTLLEDMPWLMRKVFGLMSTTPQNGAKTPIWLATAPEVERTSGKMFAKCKEVPLKGQAADPTIARELWDRSTALAQLA